MDIIKSKQDIESIFASGKRYSSRTVTMLVKENESERGPSGRVAFIAGKKLGNAVVRNKSKRILREAARFSTLTAPGYDVVLISTRHTRISHPDSVARDIDRLLKKAGVN